MIAAARIVLLLLAIVAATSAKDTCYGKILKLCKTNATIDAEVNRLLTNKHFDELLLLTFSQIEESCGKDKSEEIMKDFENKGETVEMIKELLGYLTVAERIHVKEMTVSENRLGVYGFFVAKALNFLTNPKTATLIWKIAHRLPQLSIPRSSV